MTSAAFGLGRFAGPADRLLGPGNGRLLIVGGIGRWGGGGGGGGDVTSNAFSI